ncbi:hypothetical protein [Halobellus rubicundus]|uniref:Uncharacterized protein n=1 Tax=Halobellus rubicundus TaxID=2996466 RepID=A0ABD5MEK1_9EURY
MDSSPSTESAFGLLAYFVLLLVAVFVGPLEAALGAVLYWLFGDDTGRQSSGR